MEFTADIERFEANLVRLMRDRFEMQARGVRKNRRERDPH